MRSATLTAAKRPCLDRSILYTTNHFTENKDDKHDSIDLRNHTDDGENDNNDNEDSNARHRHSHLHYTCSASPPPAKRPRVDNGECFLKPPTTTSRTDDDVERKRLPPPTPGLGGVEPEIWLAQYLTEPAPADAPYLADPPPDTVKTQHRETVVLWLLQARLSLGVARPTMYVAVSIMDAYLSRAAPLGLHLVQLLAAACVFIAVKTSEQHTLSVARLVDIAAGAFDAHALIQMEAIVLNRLSFQVAVRTSYSALRYLADIAAPSDRRVAATATFATDIALADHHCACISPSIIALAAVSLACVIVRGKRVMHLHGLLAGQVSASQIDETVGVIINAWRRAVATHDDGLPSFLVRDAPLVAARIFPHSVRYTLDCEFGVLVDIGDGTFAKWAANHVIEDLLPELY